MKSQINYLRLKQLRDKACKLYEQCDEMLNEFNEKRLDELKLKQYVYDINYELKTFKQKLALVYKERKEYSISEEERQRRRSNMLKVRKMRGNG